MLDLYIDATPNGLKVSIALEEMGLSYNVHRVFLGGEQLTPEFTKLNPNNKIPVLVDDGLVVTESGAILMYLAEKTGKLLPKDPKARVKAIEMVTFQMASIGPMMGQLIGCRGPWENKAPDVSNRYFKEVSRLFGVLNKRLEGQEYLAGSEYTIADIAMLPWIRSAQLFPVPAGPAARREREPQGVAGPRHGPSGRAEGPDDPRAVPAGEAVPGLHQGDSRPGRPARLSVLTGARRSALRSGEVGSASRRPGFFSVWTVVRIVVLAAALTVPLNESSSPKGL